MLGKDGAHFLSADKAAEFELSERQVLQTGEPYEVEEQFEQGGAERSRIVRKHRVEFGSGRRYVACFVFDATEIKRRETEAEEARRRLAVVLESLPAGVVTLAERFGGVEVSKANFELMCAHVRELMAPFMARIRNARPDHLLGTSGTVTTIAGVQMRLRRYDRSRVDGSWLTNAEIDEVVARLLAMSYEERAASPCIGRDRADLVLAGCAILDEIRRAFPADRLRVADRGLREGILAYLMKEDGAYGGH